MALTSLGRESDLAWGYRAWTLSPACRGSQGGFHQHCRPTTPTEDIDGDTPSKAQEEYQGVIV